MMANRIPLIVSRINGLDELLSDGECLFINPVISSEGEITFDTEKLSDAILTMAGDIELRIRLAENACRSFIRKFTASMMAEKMHKLFHSLTNDKKPAFEYEKSKGR
jgi:glycosyltransferase involved in cell wall biosynthesis